jgi:RNA polymerase sigma-70 factor, ECF subfamily
MPPLALYAVSHGGRKAEVPAAVSPVAECHRPCRMSLVSPDPDERHPVYATLRPLLTSIAYEMVGAVGEAEDIVQEAFLRFHRARAEGANIESPKAWLSTVVTRLAIDHVRSARVRRETYVGTWLPEPLLTDQAPDAAQFVETAEALSMAFLVLLERLSPVERAVFLLRDVFEFGFDEIADIVGKSEGNCRQIAVRSRRHIQDGRPRFEASRERREALARRFFEAVGAGSTNGLVDLLAADVVLYTDCGGKGPAFPHPIYGREGVTRIFSGYRPAALGAVEERFAELNGQPGMVFLDAEARAVAVIALDIAGGQIIAVRAISNPDKLRHLDERLTRTRSNS